MTSLGHILDADEMFYLTGTDDWQGQTNWLIEHEVLHSVSSSGQPSVLTSSLESDEPAESLQFTFNHTGAASMAMP